MAELQALDAVIFDAGGTLVRLDFEWMSECLASLGLEIPAATLRRAEIAARRRYDASLGHARALGELPPPLGARGDTDAYFSGLLEAAGVRPPRLEAALARLYERQRGLGLWSRPLEGARAAIDGIAALGLRRAVVSNSDGRAEQHLRDCDMLRGIEFVVDSMLVGVEKPDPRIFAIALERLGVAAARALFVGDIRSVDELGARAAGMRFVLVDPYGDYAAPASAAIAAMDQLPAWVTRHFAVPARGSI